MEEYTQIFNLRPEKEEPHGGLKVSEDKNLELRLGPPEDIVGYKTTSATYGAKRVIQDTAETEPRDRNWCRDAKGKVFSSPWLSGTLHSPPAFRREVQEEFLQTKNSYLQRSGAENLHCSDKKACSSPAAAETNSPQKRAALASVVGWPPVRSFRKNIASVGATKMASDELPNKTPNEGSSLKHKSLKNDLFVKINMEGVPIGRKINLKAYDSYEKLSIAIDELFRDLLAAQRQTTSSENGNKTNQASKNAGLVEGSGEYTLIYEDSEGDRILVGDVPWHMFVSTVKRLRVLKSSVLSTPRRAFTFRTKSTTLQYLFIFLRFLNLGSIRSLAAVLFLLFQLVVLSKKRHHSAPSLSTIVEDQSCTRTFHYHEGRDFGYPMLCYTNGL